MEATNQGATTNSHVEETLVAEGRDQFALYVTPLVQQPHVGDTSFHGPMEGRVDSLVCPDYGLDASFWRTSMGQAIASFGVRSRPPPEHSSPSEEEYRQIQSTIHHAQDFQ